MSRSNLNILVDILLVGVFFLICLGLGYGVLTRFDPMLITAMEDVRKYGEIVQNGISSLQQDNPGIRHRVLVPYIAHIIYLVTPNIGSWNMISFSLLVVNSLFTSFSALFILKMSYKITNNKTYSIVACLIFLLNFIIVNSYLVGSVDAAFGLFFISMFYCMQFNKWRLLPLLAIVGCLTKEAFLPVGSSLILGWILYEYFENNKINKNHLRIFVIFMLVGSACLMAMNSYVTQTIYLPWEHLSSRTHWVDSEFRFSSFAAGFIRFTFIIGWLIALAVFSLKHIPNKIIFSTLTACISTIFLGWWVSVGGADYARFIYSPAALVLSIASGISLVKILQKSITN